MGLVSPHAPLLDTPLFSVYRHPVRHTQTPLSWTVTGDSDHCCASCANLGLTLTDPKANTTNSLPACILSRYSDFPQQSKVNHVRLFGDSKFTNSSMNGWMSLLCWAWDGLAICQMSMLCAMMSQWLIKRVSRCLQINFNPKYDDGREKKFFFCKSRIQRAVCFSSNVITQRRAASTTLTTGIWFVPRNLEVKYFLSLFARERKSCGCFAMKKNPAVKCPKGRYTAQSG